MTEKTFADEILERCGIYQKESMIVCGICKQWAHEHECEWRTVDNGIKPRREPIHKWGCPVRQQVYNANYPQFYGDD